MSRLNLQFIAFLYLPRNHNMYKLKRTQSHINWVTENLKDDSDIERERRSLSVRCNMLARKFANNSV